MTPTDVAPIATNARRQLNAERVGCILQADQVLDLCESYADAIDRLAQIEAIVSAAALAEAQSEGERERMEGIRAALYGHRNGECG